jgi:hypothetical protein
MAKITKIDEDIQSIQEEIKKQLQDLMTIITQMLEL